MSWLLYGIGAIVLIGAIYWFVKGRKKYDINIGER